MLRLRLSLLSLVAVCAVSMFSATVASAAGPFWHAGGSKLVQGSKGIKLQSKGNLVLKGELAGVKVVITCHNSLSNGTIDGQGATKQGQGKGTVTYEQCEVATTPEIAGCTVAEPIKTGQLKAHLATATVQEKEQIVELFEPSPTQQTEEKVFARVTLQNPQCKGISGVWPVKGSVVSTIAPQEVEGQEGAISFPVTPITTIKHEGQEVKGIGLFLGPNTATFSGYYGARLQNSEPFGVFST